MEHIVQFGIGFDDTAIRERITTHAYDDIIEGLKEEARKATLKYSYGKPVWKDVVDAAIWDFLEDNRDDIIAGTVDKLYESVRRSKAFQVATNEAVAEAVES